MNVYTEHGFASRAEYLLTLSDEYDLPLAVVELVASQLGDTEDFDGLLVELSSIRELRSYSI
tara:strand:+ start:465 stop:650 length:186 start_codon:yes stop_codon:yes gene_type:complete